MKRAGALHAGGEVLDAAAILPFLAPVPTPDRGRRGDEQERAAILAAYEQSDRNKSRVALLLGVSRKTLYARLKRLNLTLP
jgi:transcriptional regulator of acetoin/glycerol metabolism